MSSSNKRDAQSPLQGDGSHTKRRNIFEDPPALVALDELSEDSSHSESELDLTVKPPDNSDKSLPTLDVEGKVDSMIVRMDKFFECFNIMQKKAVKKEKSDDRKFRRLELAHNELITKIVDSSSATDSRLTSIEDKLARSEESNKNLLERIASLETNQDAQHSLNRENSKRFNTLEVNQNYTNKNVLDLASEVKERKIIISRVYKSSNEDVNTTALECINKVINAAIANIHPDASLEGLRILMPKSIDNIFRIGRLRGTNHRRNISVTFMSKDDKDMVIRACTIVKNVEDIDYFISDDLTPDGRALKANLKRISTVAKSKGLDTKVTGNKVIVGSRAYASDELSMIPAPVTKDLKQEKNVEGGIAYKGERSIYSNFFPAPFTLEGEDYIHVEQYYQYAKACHHNENDVAERILRLSNPWRIKVLGDSIESNKSWLAGRMKTLYDGVSAKFRQNWPLQDELFKSKGLKLYEATTDAYFACGIGFESKRWDTMDWSGENVAGLIVMKVRDELLLELSGNPAVNNTLAQIASGHDDSHQMEIGDSDQVSCPLESTHIQHDENHTGEHNVSRNSTSSQTGLYTDAVKSPSKFNEDFPRLSQRSRGHGGRRGQSNRGRGHTTLSQPNYTFQRGRGRGSRRPQRNNYYNQYRPHNRMSQDDKNFLFGYSPASKTDTDGYITPSPRKIVKSPPAGIPVKNNQQRDWSNALFLSEHQKLGLIELGLTPESDFVRNIVSLTKGATATAK